MFAKKNMKTLTTSKIIRIGIIFILSAFLTAVFLFLIRNKVSLIGAIPIFIFMIFFCGIIVFMLRRMNKSINILKTGRKAMVTILQVNGITRNGTTGNRSKFITADLLMQITIEGQQPYELSKKMSFPYLDQNKVIPSITIPAMIDKDDNNQLELLWNEYK